MIDAGLPRFSGGESTEEKVSAIQNYLFMLLEELRYLLRHLGKDNFTQAGAQEVVIRALSGDGSGGGSGGGSGESDGTTNPDLESLIAQTILDAAVVGGTVVTNELYANYGDVADLTVWKLRTDYLRAQNYLHGSKADVNYISIHDEQIDFITGTPSGGVEQLTRDGRTYYWTDEGRTRMTCQETTAWPVMTYVYDELVKASFRFQSITTTQGVQTYAPVLVLGAGDQNGRNKAVFSKDQEGLNVILTAADGSEVGLRANANTGKLTLYGYDGNWFGTQAEYDAITVKDPNVVYFVEGTA